MFFQLIFAGAAAGGRGGMKSSLAPSKDSHLHVPRGYSLHALGQSLPPLQCVKVP